MEDQKRTNKEVLAKGVKTLAMALGAIGLGPVIVYNAFMNKEHPLFLVALIPGILIMLLAIFLILKGINLMLKSFFD
ncbi:DUF6095 family protein [Aquimarina agarilytica]|uniref:DUF6095 family protein n=1 Tax=Aquimarina agarilytica TaxID=1087449 RepID=UPI00028A0284|nr:DUF6095 family protein [Aquimarina agarilytica]